MNNEAKLKKFVSALASTKCSFRDGGECDWDPTYKPCAFCEASLFMKATYGRAPARTREP